MIWGYPYFRKHPGGYVGVWCLLPRPQLLHQPRGEGWQKLLPRSLSLKKNMEKMTNFQSNESFNAENIRKNHVRLGFYWGKIHGAWLATLFLKKMDVAIDFSQPLTRSCVYWCSKKWGRNVQPSKFLFAPGKLLVPQTAEWWRWIPSTCGGCGTASRIPDPKKK